MAPSLRPWFLCALTMAIVDLVVARQVVAGEFRVDSSVFISGRAEAITSTATYFTDLRVYDIRHASPREAVILDRNSGAMTVLDFGRQVACRVSGDEVMRAVAAIAARADDKPPAVRFAAKPKFSSNWISASELKMQAEPMSYHVFTQAGKLPANVTAYRDFADWTARLNTTSTGGMPPFARMEVNRELAAKGQLPIRVEYQQRQPEMELYSTHVYSWVLSETDRQQIDSLERDAKKFSAVDLVTFRVVADSADNR